MESWFYPQGSCDWLFPIRRAFTIIPEIFCPWAKVFEDQRR